MAGFRVLWASEFIDAARASYAANKAPYTVLDGRDIRTVQPADILAATGLQVGELDVLDGSPPCASFSTAGKREAGWGKAKAYSDKHQRTDDLFFEFSRLLRGLQPKAFVAENVSGLIKGTAKGYFLDILRELKGCGYRVEAKVLDAQWLGVPQARQRLIFVGVREDLGIPPAFPAPLPYRFTLRDALPHISRHGTAPPHATFAAADRDISATMVDSSRFACPTITTGENKGAGYVEADPDFPPATRVIHDTSGQFGAGDITDRPSPAITVGVNSLNSQHFKVEKEAMLGNLAIGKEWDKLAPGQTSDRYFSLVRTDPERAARTVTARGGQGGLATATHPVERRKFSIAELRRICGFPDDFVLTGTYAQQWERCGRAVPPVMMSHIAAAVRDGILAKQKPGAEAGLARVSEAAD